MTSLLDFPIASQIFIAYTTLGGFWATNLMDKNFLKVFLVGFTGGILGSLLFFLAGANLFGSIGLVETNLQDRPTKENPAITPFIPPSSSEIERIVFEASADSVGIQVFKDGKLVNQGNGIIISSDGLIGTIADLFVPQGVYQIFYDDKIIRGIIATQDFKSNLMILKTPVAYSNVADLDSRSDYQSGKEVLLTGKVINLGKSSAFSQRGIISYITEKTIVLDASINNYLKGATVVDMDGKFMGVVYLRSGKPNLIRPDLIKSFFDSYINTNK